MTTASISHPTGRPNFTIVGIGDLQIAFSYETAVGFRKGHAPWVVRANVWGPTTGKHLSYLDQGTPVAKAVRVSGEAFESYLGAATGQYTSPV